MSNDKDKYIRSTGRQDNKETRERNDTIKSNEWRYFLKTSSTIFLNKIRKISGVVLFNIFYIQKKQIHLTHTFYVQ